MKKYQELFLQSLKSRNYSESTIRIRKDALLSFFTYIKADKVADVTEKQIEDYRVSYVRKHYKHSTECIHISSICQFFNFLAEKLIIFSNPCQDIIIGSKKNPVPRVLSQENVERLLNSIPTNTDIGKTYALIFNLTYALALRKEEVASMKLEDMDLYKLQVLIKGKGSKERKLPFPEHLIDDMQYYLQYIRPHLNIHFIDSLWINRSGSPIKTNCINAKVHRMKESTGITPFGFHDLRRSCATHLLDSGASPVLIANLLGHSTLRTLGHYLKVSVKDLKTMVERAER